jgi:hypothetical protein
LKKQEDVLSTAQQLSPVTDDDLNKAEKDKPLKRPQKGRFGKARSGPSFPEDAQRQKSLNRSGASSV